MSSKEVENHFFEHNHCSALIKLAADFSDVWFGHNTWTSFASMTRIFKEYRFRSNNNSEKARTIAMSSYPGAINSIDDFYVTSQDLYVTETTLSIFDTDLYNILTPKSLLTWHRTMIANRLADNGKTWTEIFSKHNSGTYNNQMQILDMKLIDTTERKIQDNALWIIEQVPGYMESGDVTKVLKYGYWASYNSAYFESMKEKAGYNKIIKERPELKDSVEYYSCARANIFRREQGSVVDMKSFKKLMRLNNYLKDSYSKGVPTLAIAARGDLNSKSPDCRGATDAKVGSINDIKGKQNKKINVVAGPTNEDLPPFDTVESECINFQKGRYVFFGLPKKFEYSWVEFGTTYFD